MESGREVSRLYGAPAFMGKRIREGNTMVMLGLRSYLLVASVRKRFNCELNFFTFSRLARWRAGVSQCKAAPGIWVARSSDISGEMPGSSGAAITIVGIRILESWLTVSRSAIAKAQAANVSG